MGTKNNPGKFDCYAAAEPDEPMFILLGRDKHAPTLVWLWSVLRELDGEDGAKVAEARECVLAMLSYQNGKGRKAVGLGQAALAAVLELIRAANTAYDETKLNDRTDDAVMRRFLAATRWEDPQKAKGSKPAK